MVLFLQTGTACSTRYRAGALYQRLPADARRTSTTALAPAGVRARTPWRTLVVN
jgi:hypothetical protein